LLLGSRSRGMHINGLLLTWPFIYIEVRKMYFSSEWAHGLTLYRVCVPVSKLSSSLLLHKLLKLFILPLDLLYPLIMIVDSCTENFLCSFLADYELIQMLF